MLEANNAISKTLLTIDQYKGNLKFFKTAISDGEYSASKKNFSRLLIWKVCLLTESLDIKTWGSNLSKTRVVFHQLERQYEGTIPWWKLNKDNTYYQDKEASSRSGVKRNGSTKSLATARRSRSIKKSNLAVSTDVSDPLRSLSLSLTRPRASADTELQNENLLEAIILDVERLFPGEKFFHSSNPSSFSVKRQIIEILYIWSKCHPQVGYKQGFHEIIGLIYANIYQESSDLSNSESFSSDDMKILSMFDLHYLPHDIFSIFNRLMVQSGIISRYYENEDVLWKSIENFNSILMKVDQVIHYNLISKLKLESQLWIIRYLRLMLLREIGSDLNLFSTLWDKLIAVQSKITEITLSILPDLITYMTIVLLIRIKGELITSDFSESLSLLLHYPDPFQSNKYGQEFTTSLVMDAMKIYEVRNDDLKLYEYGIKLNAKFNPNLKFTMTFGNSSTANVDKRDESQIRSEQLKFEKYRLEMRLKKKTQSLARS